MNEAVDQATQRITQRLAGRHILLTGATGFLAKALVEKLLRAVRTVGGLHLLVRPRADGLSPRERVWNDVLGNRVFDRLRASRGSKFEELCREKIHVVSGDLAKPRLGLSAEEYDRLTGGIHLIINSAATVTFDERIDEAILLNTLGPLQLLDFAKACGNVPFLHVSTCYVCGNRRGCVIEDLSAPEAARESLPRDRESGAYRIHDLIHEAQEESRRIIEEHGSDTESCRSELIAAGMRLARRCGWNDTYTFTKWLGEQLLAREQGDVPLVIFRPAIIEGSIDEPVPGWIDGLRMADPLIAAYGSGKLSRFPGRPESAIDLIPVDFVANAIMATLPLDQEARGGLWVYQCGSSDVRPLRLGTLVRLLEDAFRKRPMSDESGRPMTPPSLRLVSMERFLASWRRRRRRLERARDLFKIFGDRGRRVRKLSAGIRLIEQIEYFANIYAPYTQLDCRFATDELRRAYVRLHPEDRKEFPCEPESIDWEDYIVDRHVPGLRSFVLGQGAEPASRLRKSKSEPLGFALIAPQTLRAENLYTAFEEAAQRCAGKAALQIRRGGRWTRYSYREAVQVTGAVMQRFADLGLAPGDRVAIVAENGPEWGLTYLGALRAGLTAVPLDPQLPPAEAWSATRFARAALMAASPAVYEGMKKARAEGDVPLIQIDETLVPPPGVARDVAPPPARVSGADLASILFTSGTVIAPKAVPLTHRNFLSNARALIDVHPVYATDEFLSLLPLYHAFEFMAGFLIPLASGATITYVEQLKGPEILGAMQQTGTTVMLAVPRLLQSLMQSIEAGIATRGLLTRSAIALLRGLSRATGDRHARRLFRTIHKRMGGRLRMIVSGGSRLEPDLLLAFRRLGFNVVEGYGMTETSPVITVSPPGMCRPGSVGRPLPNIELEIRNKNLDGIGEIWVRGPSVMYGYLDNPQATQETIEGGWLRTGDLGRLDEDGMLYLTGRSKDLIVTAAGKNVYPDEIEARYADLPYIKELCVLGLPASNGMGEAVSAAVVLDPARAPTLDRSSIEREVRAALAAVGEKLPSHQRVERIFFWNRELPKTTTLKAKRGVIREVILSGKTVADGSTVGRSADAASPACSEPPGDQHPAWSAIQNILARQSKRPLQSITPDLHLLIDLGIDSIAKIDVLSHVETCFGIEIDDETGSRIARAGDLLAAVGDRAPTEVAGQAGLSWRRRFGVNGAGRRTEGNPPVPLKPVRWAAHGVGGALMRSYVRVRAVGLENIPKTGGFILAPNHASHLDAPAVLTAIGGRRRVWVAAAEDYFFNRPWKRFVFGRVFDGIAFDRHSDGVEGLKRCGQALSRQDGLLMFPEGTRSLSGRLQPFKIGVAVLAVERQVPIIPVYIHRAFDLMRKGRKVPRPGTVFVAFASPIPPPRNDDPQDPYALFLELTRCTESAVRHLQCQWAS